MFKLYLIDPATGKILSSNGVLCCNDQELGYRCSFEFQDDALKEKDDLLNKVVWGIVQIYDEAIKNEMFYSNKNTEHQYLLEVAQRNHYLALPWYKRLFVSKPVLKYAKI